MELQQLLKIAEGKLQDWNINKYVRAGRVAAAILTDKGNVYVGVCFDISCSIGMCAERSAVANMITNGENKIVALACVNIFGDIGMPCGVCREMLMQLHKDSKDIKILRDIDGNSITLGELCPDWWGDQDFGRNLQDIKSTLQ